jgi:hypothetical protein
MSDNYGTGFQGFRARIDAVAEGLGGNPHVRTAVAAEFADTIRPIVARRLGVDSYDVPWRVDWTLATDADLDAASEAGMCRCRDRAAEDGEAIAAAPWMGATLSLRRDTVTLDGGGHSLLIAMATDGYGAEGSQHVFITDTAKTCLEAIRATSTSKPSSTTVKSKEAVNKALRRIVEAFFRVSLVDVAARE